MKIKNGHFFTEGFKRKVALEVIEGVWRCKEDARRFYGIKAKSAILDWMRQHTDSSEAVSNLSLSLEAMTPKEKEEFERLKSKIALLEKQLSDETHRSGLYKTMIDIAEQQLHIPIRKKYGAGQWKNTKSKSKQ